MTEATGTMPETRQECLKRLAQEVLLAIRNFEVAIGELKGIAEHCRLGDVLDDVDQGRGLLRRAIRNAVNISEGR
jgi:hypothetical protein